MRRAMMIELDKCVGCQACVTACKERHDSGSGAERDWVYEYEHGKRASDVDITFYPGLCMQCEEHPCTEDCPTGATYMDRDTGIVMVNPDVCIGCGNCVSMCAYGARKPDRSKGIVEKCDLCASYVARGEQPACVATCLANCRHVGDLDDRHGEFVKLIERTGAEPLTTPEVDIKPKGRYAGEKHRRVILAAGAVRAPQKSRLTRFWTGFSRPLASFVVPPVFGLTVAAGLLLNLKSRRAKVAAHGNSSKGETLERHRAGMRFLHWFNLLSWLLLFATGVGLMSAGSFALFGQTFPRAMADLFGGAAVLIRFHVVWGLFWASVIVPMFLVYKHFGIEALLEVRLTSDDMKWLLVKPLSMVGLTNRALPPQDKYNAGQKLFALLVLAGTMVIVATGGVMTFHLGSAGFVAFCIAAHKLAVVVTLLGVAVHFTMAAVLKEERPALKSMITGRIDAQHARDHNAKWAGEKLAGEVEE